MKRRPRRAPRRRRYESVSLPIWQELLVGVELLYLRISPVYWGYGVPRGDGAGVVVVPGFMGTDLYLAQLRDWLHRIGYVPYSSGIGVNAECPNLLIRQRLIETIEKAFGETGRKVHLVGHSLGGMLALAAAAQIPERIATVVTLGTPLDGLACHPTVFRTAQLVREKILERNGCDVLPACYTAACTCDFLQSLARKLPKGVRHTSIYTKTDGIVDWRNCKSGDCSIDFEVPATHMGLVFSPLVYSLMAYRLAGMDPPKRT